MKKLASSTGLSAQNPLAVISLLIGTVEAAFGYPVTHLSGPNQTIFVYFMVGFPVLLVLCFFITVWTKPGHLYSPKDYASPADFLQGIGKSSAIPPQAAQEPPRKQLGAPSIDRAGASQQPNAPE
jgi:hypothetical protein